MTTFNAEYPILSLIKQHNSYDNISEHASALIVDGTAFTVGHFSNTRENRFTLKDVTNGNFIDGVKYCYQDGALDIGVLDISVTGTGFRDLSDPEIGQDVQVEYFDINHSTGAYEHKSVNKKIVDVLNRAGYKRYLLPIIPNEHFVCGAAVTSDKNELLGIMNTSLDKCNNHFVGFTPIKQAIRSFNRFLGV